MVKSRSGYSFGIKYDNYAKTFLQVVMHFATRITASFRAVTAVIPFKTFILVVSMWAMLTDSSGVVNYLTALLIRRFGKKLLNNVLIYNPRMFLPPLGSASQNQ